MKNLANDILDNLNIQTDITVVYDPDNITYGQKLIYELVKKNI